jgi:predicted RecB family nuclease
MIRLSKSRFMAGLQCHKLLWWKVHEPNAPELQPDKVLEDLFNQGSQVGVLARDQFGGGTLIDLPHHEADARVARTKEAISAGAPALFEGTFIEDNTFVAADVLLRDGKGWRLIEVKSSSSVKEEHVPDAAVQLHVLRKSGLDVRAVEIMHLNKEFAHPDQGALFAREDVTQAAMEIVPTVPGLLGDQLAAANGKLPTVAIGAQCFDPRPCPFMDRCWPQDHDHITQLIGVGPVKSVAYMARGINTIGDLPANERLSAPAKRQIRSLKSKQVIVEPGLAEALKSFDYKLGFLDFETVSRAVPVWDGMHPWEMTAAQFSYHEARPDGTYSHAEHLAEGPQDCRPLIARKLVEATINAERVVMYTTFERTRIKKLAEQLPSLRVELSELAEKLVDMHPLIKDFVYHPDFGGSFSLKDVLTPLVPEMSYTDTIAINNGQLASVEIARLLFMAGKIPREEHDRVRADLLAYCKQDTLAMVRLLEQIRGLAAGTMTARESWRYDAD